MQEPGGSSVRGIARLVKANEDAARGVNRRTPARIRQGVRNIHARLVRPTRVPQPRGAVSGRLPGVKNEHLAPCYSFGKIV